MSRKIVSAVLVYLRRRGHFLMIQKASGLWNGLGGKCELDESFAEAACREVREESGIVLSPADLQPLGILQLPNFRAEKNEDWMITIFMVDLDDKKVEEPFPHCDEGTLHWIPIGQVESLRLWPGDRHFLPWVVDPQPFMGTIWYKNSEVERYWIQPFLSRGCSGHRSGL